MPSFFEMFSFLRQLSPSLYERYETMERNVRSSSNSFFDSYLGLAEEILRIVMAEVGEAESSHATAGAILRMPSVREHLLSAGLDEKTLGKLGDYILKINAHKHNKEKTVTSEIVISYLSVLHRVAGAFAIARGIPVPPFVEEYYRAVFGTLHTESAAVREELSERIYDLTSRVDELVLATEKESDLSDLSDSWERERRRREFSLFVATAQRYYRVPFPQEMLFSAWHRLLLSFFAFALSSIAMAILYLFVNGWQTDMWFFFISVLAFGFAVFSLRSLPARIHERWYALIVKAPRNSEGVRISTFSLSAPVFLFFFLYGGIVLIFILFLAMRGSLILALLCGGATLASAVVFYCFLRSIFRLFSVIEFVGDKKGKWEGKRAFYDLTLCRYLCEDEIAGLHL